MDLSLQSKISDILHTEPIETQGINNGCIWKLPRCYFKVYDTKGINMYRLQAYAYDSDIPYIDVEIQLKELLRFMRNYQFI